MKINEEDRLKDLDVKRIDDIIAMIEKKLQLSFKEEETYLEAVILARSNMAHDILAWKYMKSQLERY